MISNLLLSVIFFFPSLISSSYDGYKVIEVNLKTEYEMKLILQLSEKYEADIWKGPSKVISTHVMLSPKYFNDFTEALKKDGIEVKIILEDVEDAIKKESFMNTNVKLFKLFKKDGPNVNDHFATYEEIMQWISYLTNKYSFVTSNSYGKSYEGRDLKYVKISTGPNKKAILIDGGIHSREWLAVSTVTYMLEKMISDYEVGKPGTLSLLSNYDVYFIPVFNPDGYVFSHTPGNRLWRKNRKPFNYFGKKCYGVDLNRNFDSQFAGAGTSSYPCDDIYRGPYAFSEPETQQFSEFVNKLGSNLKLYFSFHAYAQFWFVPFAFGHTKPSDDSELRRVANIGNRALYGINYETFYVGSPPELLYAAAGGAYDWIKTKTKVKYAYTLELRPSREYTTGLAGFLAPISDISRSGEEVYAGLLATVQAMTN